VAVVLANLSVFGWFIWIWLIVSAAIFIYRRMKGIPFRTPKTPTMGDSADAASTSPVPPTPAAPFLTATSSEPTATTLPSPEPSPATPPPAPAAPTGYFARGAVGSTESRPASTRPTVAEAVEGIVMPCGLSPSIDVSGMTSPFRAAFLTTTAAATEVGAGIAEELERLGYALSTSTATELVGHRDGAELRVVLYPSAAAARRGSDPMFPAAPANAVGLELST
jgi:hypothetical protein